MILVAILLFLSIAFLYLKLWPLTIICLSILFTFLFFIEYMEAHVKEKDND